MPKLKNSLKELISKNGICKVMGCNNPLNAKIAEEAGFDALWFSGFELATAMCLPDANILTLRDTIYFLSAITRTINIPIIADADSGYGDLNNVVYMVQEYEKIGVSAICIEDKLFPKLNSFCEGRQLLADKNDFAAKLLAAKDAKLSEQFLIIARIEALIADSSMEEAIDRAYTYNEAGADLILIHSKHHQANQIIDFCNRFQADVPIAIIPTTYYKTDINTIQKISKKIKMVIYANQSIRASIKAMQGITKGIIANGSTEIFEDKISSIEEAFHYQGMKEHQNRYNTYEKIVKRVKVEA